MRGLVRLLSLCRNDPIHRRLRQHPFIRRAKKGRWVGAWTPDFQQTIEQCAGASQFLTAVLRFIEQR
jgi:hypothetical protein